MRTFHVAVVANSEEEVVKFLLASPNGPNSESGIDCWWIAEDDRHDRSDNDSAIFVPRGAQMDVAHLLESWIENNQERWAKEGYPYAETDVTGAWFP